MQRKLRFSVVVFLGVMAALVFLVKGVPSTSAQVTGDLALLREQLKSSSSGEVRLSLHNETGLVRFVGATPEFPMSQPRALSANTTPQRAAIAFLQEYAPLFGLTDASAQLSLMSERALEDGRSITRFQQRHAGVPVVGGELIVQLDSSNNVISISGETLPALSLDTTPLISAEEAAQVALAVTAKSHGVESSELSASEPELWLFNPALLGGPGLRMTALVWRAEVTPNTLGPVREMVLVDARTGAVALHFNQIAHAKSRIIYNNNNDINAGLPGVGPVRSEGGASTGIADVDLAYDYAGDTYDFFMEEHGRDSLDDEGMALISTVKYCEPGYTCPFANAFWNGEQMAYGDGYASADDVVGHELAHGVTDFSSGLFYYYQSGAINESLSDVWGEFIDLTNGKGNDSAGVRWLMGDDLPPATGVIRDMENPPAYDHPDRIGSPIYHCESWDSGGVHINSGVNNKAAFLMTDGGTFNGQTVTGIGISKVADLYYEVQTNMLVSGSDYNDLYDMLIQASVNLGYSSSDRQQIQKALLAVEMNELPEDCAAVEAPVCPAGQSPVNLFFDGFEAGGASWTTGAIVGNSQWYAPMLPNPYNFGPYAAGGEKNLWGYDQGATSDTFIAMNSSVALPANAWLHFDHAYDFESGFWDGGVLEYSTNNGSTWLDAGSLLTDNPYNGVLSGSPLSGRAGFGSTSYGYISSRANLSTLSGQSVRIRFRIGTDFSVDAYGWFIDNVRIYTCSSATATPTQVPPTATRTPTRTPTRTATVAGPTATRTPTRTATQAPPTATRTPTRTPTRTATVAGATATRTPTRTATQVPPTATRTPTRTATVPSGVKIFLPITRR